MSLATAKRKRTEQDVPPGDHAFAERKSDADAERPTPQALKRAKRSVSKDLRQHGYLGGTYVGELYRSNMFKLQVDALLAQLKPNILPIENTINNVLRDLKSVIEAIPEREPLLVFDTIISHMMFSRC